MGGTLLFTAVAACAFLLGLAVAFLRSGWLVRRPRVTLAVVAALSLAAVASLFRLDPPGFRLSIDPASEPLIARNDPGRAGYQQALLDFGSDDVYVVAMETEDVFTGANLTALQDLTEELRALPGIASVESLARVLAVRWDPQRELVRVDRFLQEVPTDAAALAELRQRALADPIYRKTLISPDGRTAAIDITFQAMSDGEFVALDLDERIAAILREATTEGRRFYVAGRPHVRAQVYHIIVRDLATLVPVAVVVAAAALWAMAGSWWGMAIPLVACLLATLWVYGAMALLGVDINLITLVLGPMMICIGSVYGVHFVARFQLIVADCEDSRAAAHASLRYARTPVTLAGLTTCIGFGSLLLSDVPATNELGAFAVFGVASVTWISLVGVPAALALLPNAARGAHYGAFSIWFGARLDSVLGGIARLASRRPNAVLVFWAVVVLLAVAAIPRIRIDTDFITFFGESSVVRSDFEAVNRLLAGAVPIYVTLDAPTPGAFREPATLEAVARLQTRLEELDGVNEVLSSVDLVRLANQAMNGGDAREARIPTTRAAVAEVTFLLPKNKLRRYTNSNHQRANLVVRSGRSGSAAVRDLERRIEQVLAAAELPAGFTAGVTGNAILLNRSADEIAGNQATQVGLAALAIFVLISGVFRAPRLALLAMVPNIAPVLIYFGLLGLGAAPLSIPTGLIGCIALGIAIDDTMHFLVAYRHERGRGLEPAPAVVQCLRDVGRPIVVTSIVLVIGFLVILASGFATLQEFGALTALTLAICLSTDLLLLPALLVRLRA